MAVKIDANECTLTISATDNASGVILRAESNLQGLADTNNNVVQRMQTQWDSMGGNWRQNMDTLNTMNRLAARTAQSMPTVVDRDLLKKLEAEQNTLKLMEDGIGSLGGKSLQGGGKVLGIIGRVKNLFVEGIAEKVKYQEATIKTGRAVATEMLHMGKSRTASEGLKDAYYDLYLSKRKLAEGKLEKSLETQDTLLDKLKDKIKFYASESEKLNWFGSADRAREQKEKYEKVYEHASKERRVDQELLKQMKKDKPQTKAQLFGEAASKQPVADKGVGKPRDAGETAYEKSMAALNEEDARAKAEQARTALQGVSGMVGQMGGEKGAGLGMMMTGMQGIADIASGEDPHSQEIERLEQFYAKKQELMDQNGADAEVLQKVQKDKEAAIEKQQNQKKLSMASSAAGTMAGLMYTLAQSQGKHSKAAFAAYKAFAIGQAIIDTYKAAQGAYSALAGIPIIGPVLGVAAAAAAIMAGMARVKAIRAQKPGGSAASAGGGGGAISASSAAAPSTAGLSAKLPEKALTATEPSQVVNVHVYGNIVDHDAFARELIPSIEKASSDGVR